MVTTRPGDAELLASARTAAHNSYSPYSHFPVGAALITDSGEIVSGCNVENAAYGEAICAERNAVTTMVAAAAGTAVETIAVVGLHASPCWPCGSCRQVLREFNCRRVIVEGPDGLPLDLSLGELLPHSFGPEALEG